MYNNNCEHDNYSPNEVAQFYGGTLIDFESVFNTLKQRSERIASNSATGTTTVSGTIVTFTAPEGAEEGSVIYFEISSLSGITEIDYVNIPTGAYMIVNVTSTGMDYIGTAASNSYGGTVVTKINNDTISNQNSDATNNNALSSYIMYNYAEATEIVFACNFNGTILAPNASVNSGDASGCQGHLSGALVAQSYEGTEEFGYRPFLGPIDILGAETGYDVPVVKVLADGKTYLQGATIGIYTLDEDGEYQLVNTIETAGEDYWQVTQGAGDDLQYDYCDYIEFPSGITSGAKFVDSDGTWHIADDDGNSTEEEAIYTTTYYLKEVDPPEGYLLSDDYLEITLTETVLDVYTGTSGDMVPCKVDVKVTTQQGNNDPVLEYHLVYEDIYVGNEPEGFEQEDSNITSSTNSDDLLQRIITIYSDEDSVEAIFHIDYDSNGDIAAIYEVADTNVEESTDLSQLITDLGKSQSFYEKASDNEYHVYYWG